MLNKRSLNKMANDHWEYIRALIENEHSVGDDPLYSVKLYTNLVEFHYKSALIHGFKHGVQWREEQKDD